MMVEDFKTALNKINNDIDVNDDQSIIKALNPDVVNLFKCNISMGSITGIYNGDDKLSIDIKIRKENNKFEADKIISKYAFNIEEEKLDITSNFREILKILIEYKMDTFRLYNDIEDLKKIEYKNILENINKAKKLNDFKSIIDEYTKQNPELIECKEKLETSMNLIMNDEKIIKDKQFKSSLDSINEIITDRNLTRCYKCLNGFEKGFLLE